MFGISIPAAWASLTILSAYKGNKGEPREESACGIATAALGLACKTIGLSIISSFPSFPLTPSAPRVEFAILCKINAARYTSASEGAKAFLIVSTWLGWIACCCGKEWRDFGQARG